MPSVYIDPTEYAAYGLPATTTVAQIQQASTQVDAYLQRKQGCVWTPDATGNPCYMSACQPSLTLTSTGPIAPGDQVTVPYTGAPLNIEQIGEVVIIDRTSSGVMEACAIAAIATGSITLASVANNHPAGAEMDLGMTIYEQRTVPHNRSIARVAQYPVLRLVSGIGRYGYGRRTDQMKGTYQEFNLLATISAFGGPPPWVFFDTTQCSIASDTAEIWVPPGVLLAYFTDVRLRYIAGWQKENLPYQIKQATANILNAMTSLPVSTTIKSFRDSASGISVDRWGATLLSDDTKSILTPFQARALG